MAVCFLLPNHRQMLDAATLPGVPAPFWFVEFFKVVGFFLHLIPMGIWFAGLPVAIICYLFNTQYSRRYANQMFGQFPILMALGINFGIVPLLFLQTTYYKNFYTATILSAWHWITVVPILIVGYYALYIAAYSRKQDGFSSKTLIAGIVASVSLIAIGLLITSGLTLMVRSDLWAGIMEKTNYYGATTGLANNFRDPAVLLRFAAMFALALMTTAAWTQFLPLLSSEPDSGGLYRRWCNILSAGLASISCAILFSVEGIVKQPSAAEHIKIIYPYFGIVALLAFISALLFFAAATVKLDNGTRKTLLGQQNGCIYFGIAAVIVHILTLASFGIVRQIGQNAGAAQYVDVSKMPLDVQWSPLLAFLLIFAAGLLVIAWMVKQVVVNVSQKS